MSQRALPAELVRRAEQRIELLSRETDLAKILRLASSPDPVRRAGAAENPLLPIDECRMLAIDQTPRVVLGVARNPAADGEALHESAVTAVCKMAFSKWPRVSRPDYRERVMKRLSRQIATEMADGTVGPIPGAFHGVVGMFEAEYGERWGMEFVRWAGESTNNMIRLQTLVDVCKHQNVADKTHMLLLSLDSSTLSGTHNSFLSRELKSRIVRIASRETLSKTLEQMSGTVSDRELLREILTAIKRRGG